MIGPFRLICRQEGSIKGPKKTAYPSESHPKVSHGLWDSRLSSSLLSIEADQAAGTPRAAGALGDGVRHAPDAWRFWGLLGHFVSGESPLCYVCIHIYIYINTHVGMYMEMHKPKRVCICSGTKAPVEAYHVPLCQVRGLPLPMWVEGFL